MKNVVIIQTRMGSTRLPGKVLYPLNKKTVLEQVVERVKKAHLVDEIVVATTTSKSDDIIAHWAIALGVDVFRGSETDVLSRYYLAAKQFDATDVIRITSDCPLIDPRLIDEMLKTYHAMDFKMVTNSGPYEDQRTFPRGLDVEIFDFDLLKEAYFKATEDYEREHVTPYLYKNFKENIYHYLNETDLSFHRWTLDTIEDFDFIKKVYEGFESNKASFDFKNIHRFLSEHEDVIKLNQHIEQKTVKY